MKIIRSKFPHLKMVEDKVVSYKTEIELLKKRITFSDMSFDNKFQATEHKLLILRTERELSGLHKKLHDATEYVKGYLITLQSIIDDLGQYDSVINQAKKSKDEKIINCINQFKQFNFDENNEAKLMFFAELKKTLADIEKK